MKTSYFDVNYRGPRKILTLFLPLSYIGIAIFSGFCGISVPHFEHQNPEADSGKTPGSPGASDMERPKPTRVDLEVLSTLAILGHHLVTDYLLTMVLLFFWGVKYDPYIWH